MIKFGRFIAKHRVLVLIIALLLLIPSVLGYAATRVNYDILTYLPDNIDTMVGQEILQDEFGKGAYSMVVVKGMDDKDVAKMREEFTKVDGVADVLWYDSIASLSVPKEVLPDDLLDKFNTEDSTMMLVFFKGGTSSDETLEALKPAETDCRKAGTDRRHDCHHLRHPGSHRAGGAHLCSDCSAAFLCGAGHHHGFPDAAAAVHRQHRHGNPV